MIQRLCSALALSLLLAGCASDPVPNEQMRLTEQAIEQARTVGAGQTNEAFKLALAKFALAQKNMTEADYKRARVLAEQAELDARLAQAQVLRDKSGAQLGTLNRSIERLRRRLGDKL